jgi:uncharacterized protein (DUF1330 family)
MENEKEPLVEVTTTEEVAKDVESVQPTEDVKEKVKTYTQAEVDELLKGKFTQDQVNEIIEKRLSREKKKTPDANEDFDNLKNELAETKNKLVEYEKRNELAKYNIEDEYKEYVDFKVSKMVSQDKDYATALKEFMEGEGAKYIATNKPVKMPRPANTDKLSDDAEAVAKLRKAMGLK